MLFLSYLFACAEPDASDIMLAVGDSFLDFHVEENASIPEVAAERLGYSIQNNALSGATMLGEDGIPTQYEEGNWPWIIVSGGGNDANDECGCEASCVTGLIDSMVSEDLSSGVLTELLDQSIGNGSNVALTMYMPITADAADGFGNCVDVLATLTTRYEALADSREEVLFVNSGDIISPETTPEAYEEDGVHPSVEGSAMIGEYIAEKISAFSGE